MATILSDRQTFVYLAKLSQQAERYDEMVKAIKKLANLNVDMTVEERNLLSVAYRNIVGDRRASWTAVASVEQKEQSEGNHQNANRIRVYRHKIESELSHICNDLINVIDDHLIPFSSNIESTVFYYKMKGDYNRYLAEFKTGDERKEAVDQSLKAYEAATGMAEVELAPTNPIRLALALNFSVFHYEIMDSRERACYVAKLAYDEAISEVDVKNKDFDKDTTSIMQFLRENLLLWTIFVPEDGGNVMSL